MFPIGNLLPALALDRIGRRWTMIWGCAGLSLCMMFLAALLSDGGKATASAAVSKCQSLRSRKVLEDMLLTRFPAFFFLYMLIFGGTINVVPWGKIRSLMPQTNTCQTDVAQSMDRKFSHSRQGLGELPSLYPATGFGTSSLS